ncbi:polysaccharide pyruvyl transferase family protein [Massilia sp.]|uniref:polysaccharide pyruvyl transferase family protein n=1 Tax=Massilia sp. TaxID=1882437 RepID=UPI0028A045CF|nr:polysaccharide pyruvyl transferase family protein [Massilia sp.]
MKLYYYKHPTGNFGDDLNPWIWETLAPELFDEDASQLFVGIGTLINDKVPAQPQKLVFGSGVGYNGAATIDARWKFYGVRGPRSAQVLNLDPSLVLSDPAVLLTQVAGPAPAPTGKVVFMPHHGSLGNADWRPVCEQAGIEFIDPSDDARTTVEKIRGARLVIAEAMHAAIVADAFRVPWIPVSCYDHILDFKWRDWCESLQMDYRPTALPTLWDMERNLAPADRMKGKIKRALRGAGIWSDNWTPPVPATSGTREFDEASARLAALARPGATVGHVTLSDEQRHRESIERQLERLQLVRRDHAAARSLSA